MCHTKYIIYILKGLKRHSRKVEIIVFKWKIFNKNKRSL